LASKNECDSALNLPLAKQLNALSLYPQPRVRDESQLTGPLVICITEKLLRL